MKIAMHIDVLTSNIDSFARASRRAAVALLAFAAVSAGMEAAAQETRTWGGKVISATSKPKLKRSGWDRSSVDPDWPRGLEVKPAATEPSKKALTVAGLLDDTWIMDEWGFLRPEFNVVKVPGQLVLPKANFKEPAGDAAKLAKSKALLDGCDNCQCCAACQCSKQGKPASSSPPPDPPSGLRYPTPTADAKPSTPAQEPGWHLNAQGLEVWSTVRSDGMLIPTQEPPIYRQPPAQPTAHRTAVPVYQYAYSYGAVANCPPGSFGSS